ncbi:BCL2/adenovirus E1B 19 kDa protein-interacting protein 3 isoform X2 [Entelurus aequoreus]|uniref:BCL2/adenovirus E1B 19 kDa protein-interacting protein 3 isoform X2 n=1 Tax=Entelurus aequoreus TaxID=161455 RepID=UPI002B1D8469|nr:BCL2/adenovirus E1B 19 kDa protein-interacting protein 3 isoform X2 [Entelurus aequoreus]
MSGSHTPEDGLYEYGPSHPESPTHKQQVWRPGTRDHRPHAAKPVSDRNPREHSICSWVELEELIAAVSRSESLSGPQDSISSALQGELERILLEAQLECERNRDSPPQVVTPQTAGSPRPPSDPDSDCITIQEEGDRRDTDWVWDWSSRPENMPPKDFVFQHPKQPSSLSVRKTEVMKRGIFSSDVLLILVPSLLASHLLTLGIGIYIGKRLASSTTSTL